MTVKEQFIVVTLAVALAELAGAQSSEIDRLFGLLKRKADEERTVEDCKTRVDQIKGKIMLGCDAKTIDLRQAYVDSELAKGGEAAMAVQVYQSEVVDLAKIVAEIEVTRLRVRAAETLLDTYGHLAMGLSGS